MGWLDIGPMSVFKVTTNNHLLQYEIPETSPLAHQAHNLSSNVKQYKAIEATYEIWSEIKVVVSGILVV